MMVIGRVIIVICLSQLLNVRRFTMFIIKKKIEKLSSSDIKYGDSEVGEIVMLVTL